MSAIPALRHWTLPAAALAAACSAMPAAAELSLCNNMSYVVEAALALDSRGMASSQGWYRVEPGQCRAGLPGSAQTARIYVHARALPVYGGQPSLQDGHADFCVIDAPPGGSFSIRDARNCRAGQQSVRFSEVIPLDADGTATVTLAEDGQYDEEQARLAGIQRLLGIAGYDTSPIDGVAGPKTDAAIGAFIKDQGLPADAAGGPRFFDQMIAAALQPEGRGFSWCNDTPFPVLAAIGLDDKGTVVSRGWYRIEAGGCLRPDVAGTPRRVFSYAEAVDGDGRVVHKNGRPLAWGGNQMLCTRDVKFELSDHKACEANGLTASPFAAIDLAGRPSIVLRFKEP
ncbi:MAG TPA: DUF1036 domain-containing protein [Xanthobacteraceae bacterium]|nr:DUF1036 domain-containing protein [Xanthobacteraceae bacterium]